MKEKLLSAKLYCFTPDKYANGRDLLKIVEDQYIGGADIIQLREKKISARENLELAFAIKKLAVKYNKIFIVNDDIAVAKISDADGIHLGQDDIGVDYARSLLGVDKIIGLSTHTLVQYTEGQISAADYTAIGPIFSTVTKDNPAPTVGMDSLKMILKHKKKFTVAIGGITTVNIREMLELPIDCYAVVSAISGNTDVKNAAADFRNIL